MSIVWTFRNKNLGNYAVLLMIVQCFTTQIRNTMSLFIVITQLIFQSRTYRPHCLPNVSKNYKIEPMKNKSYMIKLPSQIQIIYRYVQFLGRGNIVSGPNAGKTCHFPFEYEGEKHSKCILNDSGGQPWCSSTAYYTAHTFGYCDCPHYGLSSS